MSVMYIRVKKDGFILPYNEYLASNPECEVVPEEIAYPERFVPPAAAQRKSALDLSTADIPSSPPYTPPELAVDASRKLPK